MDDNTLLYNWEFNSEKDRSPLWYTLAISIVIGLVIWGFLTKQYGMSFIVLLISGLFYYLENNSEEIINVDIANLGIRVGKKFYDYGNIDSYTLIYAGNQAVYIRLNLLKKWISNLDLHIDNEIAENLQSILPNLITENGKQDLSWSDKIIAWMKL